MLKRFPNSRQLRSVLLIALSTACAPRSAVDPADTVLVGGAVVCMDEAGTVAEAVAVRGERIVFVGSSAEAQSWIGAATRVVQIGRGMVLPGFHDSHIHLVAGGIELSQCVLSGLESPEKVLEEIAKCAERDSEAAWVRGGGWELPVFPAANPSKHVLDAVVGDRPAYLEAADGHSAWVNSRALEIAGLKAASPDPPNGRIERDPLTGEPSGTLREAAMDLVRRNLPEVSNQEYENGLRRALALANSLGITSLIEASGDPPIQRAYRTFSERGELTARVVVSQRVDLEDWASQIARLDQVRQTLVGQRLRADATKIFVDGVIEAHTAALLEPYLDRPEDAGEPNLSPEELNRLVSELDRRGFQIHLHAIGDRAVRMGLDSFERAAGENGSWDRRHHMAHIELIDPDDIPRFARLGVIANFQPLWAYPDTYITELTEPVLGPRRSRWLYPMGSVLRAGGRVVGGSDWTVSSMNPLDAIQVAVTRRPLEEPDGPAWIPEERVELNAMLRAYTIEGAYLSRQEEQTGSIEVGKRADLVLLERNLYQVPVGEIHRVRVRLTLLDGRPVFESEPTS